MVGEPHFAAQLPFLDIESALGTSSFLAPDILTSSCGVRYGDKKSSFQTLPFRDKKRDRARAAWRGTQFGEVALRYAIVT